MGLTQKIIFLGKNPLLKIKNKQKNVPGGRLKTGTSVKTGKIPCLVITSLKKVIIKLTNMTYVFTHLSGTYCTLLKH